MTDSVLDLRNVYKGFGGNLVLKGVDLKILPRQIVGVIGENGAGKSTLLKVITGRLNFERGSIQVNGKFQTSTSNYVFRQCKPVGFGFQFPAILEGHRSINTVISGNRPWDKRKFRSILMNFSVEKNKFDQDTGRAVETAESILGQQFDNNKLGSLLSFGEARKVQFSRIKCSDANLIILDEPTTGLEKKYYQDLSQWIVRESNKGTSFLIVEHNVQFLQHLTKSIFELNNGKLFPIQQKPLASTEKGLVRSAKSHNNYNSTKLIWVENLATEYVSRRKIFHSFSFTVRAGECWWFRGSNGSGKSTALKALLGFTPIIENPVNHWIGDHQICDLLSRNQGVSYMPQGSNIFEGLNVEESIKIATRYLTTEQTRDRWRWITENFPEVNKLRPKKIHLLSGGYRKLISFLLAMMTDPKLLMLDEPLAGLNPNLRKRVVNSVQNFIALGGAVILVEHQETWVESLSTNQVFFTLGQQPDVKKT